MSRNTSSNTGAAGCGYLIVLALIDTAPCIGLRVLRRRHPPRLHPAAPARCQRGDHQPGRARSLHVQTAAEDADRQEVIKEGEEQRGTGAGG